MCCSRPSGILNSSAMPRGLRAESGALPFPPANEKRATTGTGWPENNAALLNACASLVPTNSPTAQVPFVWLRRCPGITPNTSWIASTTCGALTGLAAGACCAWAGIARNPAAASSEARACRVNVACFMGWILGEFKGAILGEARCSTVA